jgi:hypothetical protein
VHVKNITNEDGFDFDTDERATLFKKYNPMMTDYESFKIMNRVNED